MKKSKQIKSSTSHLYSSYPFDYYLINHLQHFPSAADYKELQAFMLNISDLIVSLNMDITVNDKQMQELEEMLQKTTCFLNEIRKCKDSRFLICEFSTVNDYVLGTMISRNVNAEIVVVLRYVSSSIIEGLMERMREMYSNATKIEISKLKQVTFSLTEKGIEISAANNVKVTILIAVYPANLYSIEDPTLRKIVVENYAAIRRTNFCSYHFDNKTKTLARVLRDVTLRFKDFGELLNLKQNTWIIDLLAIYVVNTTFHGLQLPLGQSFMRVFQLLACGLFTPGSHAFEDPCENNHFSIHSYLTFDEQEKLCEISQDMLMKLLTGQHKEILGVSNFASD